MTKIAGSGYINKRHGSPDPDQHQNVMDPQQWFQDPHGSQYFGFIFIESYSDASILMHPDPAPDPDVVFDKKNLNFRDEKNLIFLSKN
jgi:hypothetical protein